MLLLALPAPAQPRHGPGQSSLAPSHRATVPSRPGMRAALLIFFCFSLARGIGRDRFLSRLYGEIRLGMMGIVLTAGDCGVFFCAREARAWDSDRGFKKPSTLEVENDIRFYGLEL